MRKFQFLLLFMFVFICIQVFADNRMYECQLDNEPFEFNTINNSSENNVCRIRLDDKSENYDYRCPICPRCCSPVIRIDHVEEKITAIREVPGSEDFINLPKGYPVTFILQKY